MSYTPLNGKEIREIIEHQVMLGCERIPLTSEGLAYHGIKLEVSYHITAYQEDMPVPPSGVIGPFRFLSKDKDYHAEMEKHMNDADRLVELRDEINKVLADSHVVIVQDVVEFNGSDPAEVREINDLVDPDAAMNAHLRTIPMNSNEGFELGV